jgi:hypothetical protein
MTLARKKEIGVLVFVSLYTLLLFILFALMVQQGGGQLSGFNAALFAFLALLWVALVQFHEAITFERPGMNWFLMAIVPVLVAAIGQFSLAAIVSAVLAGIFLIVGRSTAHAELANRISFKVSQIFRISTRYVLLALAFALIGIGAPNVTKQLTADNVQIPQRYLEAWVAGAGPIVSQVVPGYDPNKTVDEFIIDQVKRQEGGSIPTNQELVIPPGQIAIARNQLGNQFGVTLTGQEKLSSLAGQIANHYLQTWAKYNRLLFVGIIIIILFLVWRALTQFLIWPTLWVLMFLIYFATRIGLVYKIKTAATMERLQL